LHQLLKLMKLLRDDLKQLLEVVDLLLHVLQILELLRHDVQQLLQLLRHDLKQLLQDLLLLQRVDPLLRLQTERVRCERVPPVRRYSRECLADIARGCPGTIRDSRHSDSSMIFLDTIAP